MRSEAQYRGGYVVLRHTPYLHKRGEGPDDKRNALRRIALSATMTSESRCVCVTTHEQQLNEATYDCDAGII